MTDDGATASTGLGTGILLAIDEVDAVNITTAQAGNWSAPSTWTGGVVPGVGNTATINHGPHVIDVSVTVGTSPATGGAAAIQANAATTIASGVVVEARGDVIGGDIDITMQAGSTLSVNPPAGAAYKIVCATNHNQFNARLVCQGTSGSHCTVRKTAGALGTVEIATGGWEPASNVQATFTDFIDLANGNAGITFSNLSATPATFYDDCTYTGCGQVSLPIGIQPNGSVRFRRCKFVSGASFVDLVLTASGAQSGGERIIDKCSMPLGLFSGGQDILLTECRIGSMQNPCAWHANSKDNIVLATAPDVFFTNASTTQRLYLVQDVADNGHWLIPNGSLSQTFDLVIFESPNTWGNGDGLSLPQPGAAQTYTLKRAYMLPNANGLCPGRIVSGLGNVNVTFLAEHCTAIVNTLGGVGVSETYAGHAGMGQSVKSNLFWVPSGQTGYGLIREPGSAVQDIVAPANFDYNGLWGIAAGTDGNGVNVGDGPTFFTTAGQHQLNGVVLVADPFVDKTRKMATWDASLGGPGTFASARDNLYAQTSGYDVAALIDYVIAGYAVTAPALQNAGHDAVTIGAGAFVGGGTTVTPGSVVVQATVVAPVVVRGPTTLVPGPLSERVLVATPSVQPGPVLIGPVPVATTFQVVAPSVSTTTTLLPGLTIQRALVLTPNIQRGSVAVGPAPVAVQLTPLLSAVTAGAVVLTPGAVSAKFLTVVPSVGAGNLLQPFTTSARLVPLDPTLVRGAVTLQPTAASVQWIVPGGSIQPGTRTLFSAPAAAKLVVISPSLVRGGVTAVPAVVAMRWSVPSPALIGDSILTPAAAAARWVVPSHTVLSPLTIVGWQGTLALTLRTTHTLSMAQVLRYTGRV